jgi:hypothetical protein
MTEGFLSILADIHHARCATDLLAVKDGFARLKAGERRAAQKAVNARLAELAGGKCRRVEGGVVSGPHRMCRSQRVYRTNSASPNVGGI